MSRSSHQNPGHARGNRTRKGQIMLLLIGGGAAVAVVGVAAMLIGGGGSGGGGEGGTSDRFEVKRGTFNITLPVMGELAAQEQIEIRNRMDTQAIITEIIPEGTWANAGDVLLRLNDEELRNKVNDAKDAVDTATADAEAADAELRITIKEQESEIAKAKLAVELAELALNAWVKGEDPSKTSELTLALETAAKNYDRLEDRYVESKKLVEQKFISLDEYKQDEIALMEAKAKHEQATRDLDTYSNYTRLQDEKTKNSDLEQAQGELERTQERLAAKVHSAKTALDSKKYQLESKKERLRLLEGQLAQCVQKAPSPGLVVYASSLDSGMRFGDGDGTMQVGTQLWPNQLVIILPNTSKMVADVKVSEAQSGLIRAGQKASIVPDAMADTALTGEVIKVGVLAETGGWRDPNRRDYTVRIALNNASDLGLKPSMRCKSEIYVGRVNDAMHVPVQAVYHAGPLAYVYVPQGGGFAQKKVETGRTSEQFTEILEGLAEGDIVLLRDPQPEEVIARLAEPKREELPEAMMGEAPKEAAPAVQNTQREGGAGNGDGQRGPRGGGEGRSKGDRAHADGGAKPAVDATANAEKPAGEATTTEQPAGDDAKPETPAPAEPATGQPVPTSVAPS